MSIGAGRSLRGFERNVKEAATAVTRHGCRRGELFEGFLHVREGQSGPAASAARVG
jgi:hypothetical protein